MHNYIMPETEHYSDRVRALAETALKPRQSFLQINIVCDLESKSPHPLAPDEAGIYASHSKEFRATLGLRVYVPCDANPKCTAHALRRLATVLDEKSDAWPEEAFKDRIPSGVSPDNVQARRDLKAAWRLLKERADASEPNEDIVF